MIICRENKHMQFFNIVNLIVRLYFILKNPLPPDPWEGIRQAKQEGNICMQYDLFTGVLTGMYI